MQALHAVSIFTSISCKYSDAVRPDSCKDHNTTSHIPIGPLSFPIENRMYGVGIILRYVCTGSHNNKVTNKNQKGMNFSLRTPVINEWSNPGATKITSNMQHRKVKTYLNYKYSNRKLAAISICRKLHLCRTAELLSLSSKPTVRERVSYMHTGNTQLQCLVCLVET